MKKQYKTPTALIVVLQTEGLLADIMSNVEGNSEISYGGGGDESPTSTDYSFE